MTDSVQPRIEKIDATTKLAVDRTRLAYERTLMAWVRTAISLISFGFTIYKFFQIEGAGKQDGVTSATEFSVLEFSVLEFSVLMIVFGLVSLLMATLEHRRDLNALRGGNSREIPAALIGLGASCIDFSLGNSGVSYGAITALGKHRAELMRSNGCKTNSATQIGPPNGRSSAPLFCESRLDKKKAAVVPRRQPTRVGVRSICDCCWRFGDVIDTTLRKTAIAMTLSGVTRRVSARRAVQLGPPINFASGSLCIEAFEGRGSRQGPRLLRTFLAPIISYRRITRGVISGADALRLFRMRQNRVHLNRDVCR